MHVITYRREQRASDLKDIQDIAITVLNVEEDDPLFQWMAANSVKSARTFITLTPENVGSWEYPLVTKTDKGHETTSRSTLDIEQTSLVCRAIWYLQHLESTKYGVGFVPYELLEHASFIEFSNNEFPNWQTYSCFYNFPRYDPLSKSTELEAFLMGTSTDIDNVPRFDHDDQWEQWSAILNAECDSMHVGKVLIPGHLPHGSETMLFEAHNEFVYKILQRTVHTKAGRYFVQRHRENVMDKACTKNSAITASCPDPKT